MKSNGQDMLVFDTMSEISRSVPMTIRFVEGDRLLSYIGRNCKKKSRKNTVLSPVRLLGDVFSFMDFENIQPDA